MIERTVLLKDAGLTSGGQILMILELLLMQFHQHIYGIARMSIQVIILKVLMVIIILLILVILRLIILETVKAIQE